jgi:hypothetical protein
MAFRFQWPYFSEEFIQEAKTMLTNALNKGNKPAVIVDHITVKELDMGTLVSFISLWSIPCWDDSFSSLLTRPFVLHPIDDRLAPGPRNARDGRIIDGAFPRHLQTHLQRRCPHRTADQSAGKFDSHPSTDGDSVYISCAPTVG